MNTQDRRWSTSNALVVGAILIAGGLWFAYGLVGPAAYADPETNPPRWFRWEALAYSTVALAVAIAVFLPFARGFVTDAVLVAVVVGSLGLGVALGGGPVGGLAAQTLAEFFVAVLLVGVTAWLGGVLVGALWRWAGRRWPLRPGKPARTFARARRYDDWRLPAGDEVDSASGAGAVALGAFVALGLAAFILLGLASRAEETLFPPTTQSTSTTAITIKKALWGAVNHSFLPRLGDQTVALRVRYVASEGEVAYSHADWVGRDSDGVIYRPAVWSKRKPLGSGVIGPSRGSREKVGWIAFVIPESTKSLKVTFEQGDAEPLDWTISSVGARKAVPVRTPEPTDGRGS